MEMKIVPCGCGTDYRACVAALVLEACYSRLSETMIFCLIGANYELSSDISMSCYSDRVVVKQNMYKSI